MGPPGPNTSSKVSRSATSRSASVTGRPRSTREVTPCSRMPQGTMPAKCERSGSRLIEMPCSVTQRRTLTPMAAILSSRPPSRTTQMPTRPSRRSPLTWKRDRKSTRLNSSHVRISYAVFCLKKKKHHQQLPAAQNQFLLLFDTLHLTLGYLRCTGIAEREKGLERVSCSPDMIALAITLYDTV